MEKSDRGTTGLQVVFPALSPIVFSLPVLTQGMCSNVVLAVAMARELGISLEQIRERLFDWQPSARRGEIVRCDTQVYYVDCYNANPASMIDTMRFFEERFAKEPKLYVLGSMREMGTFEEAAHRAVGAALRLQSGDRAAFLGEGREALRTGARLAGNPDEQIILFPTTEEAREVVESFAGAILLKGSRAYALETLLPDSHGTAGEEGVAC